jgi:hypothetical protein
LTGASAGPAPARGPALGYAGGALLLAAAGFGWSAAATIGEWDEAWFLQVVARVRAGETLYQDVFYGATPLGVGLGVAATSVFGVEIGAVKAARVACLVASALLACRIAWRLTGSHRYAPFLLGAALLYAPPDPEALYTPLAETLLLGCAALALAPAPRPIAAGLCAGLCLATKQNTGALALVALLAALPLGAPAPARAIAGRGLRAASAGAAVVLLVLLPVAWAGALPAFADLALWNKRAYLALAGVPFANGLRALGAAAGAWREEGGLARFFALQAFALPLVAAALVPAALARARDAERRALAIVVLFAGAALASALPRADLAHVRHAVPALLVLVVASWAVARRGARGWARGVETLAAIWLVTGLVAALVETARPPLRGERVWSTLPHMRGALLHPAHERALRAQGAALASAPDTLIVSPRAGLLYLLSGVRNPTPYDWPGRTSLGSRGESGLIERIARGELASVCLDSGAWPFRPRALEDAVRQHLAPAAELGPCTLYRPAAGAPEGTR